jgi:hypothetical protein
MFNQNQLNGPRTIKWTYPKAFILWCAKKVARMTLLFVIVMLVTCLISQKSFALSDPINQSLDEFTNMTKADNALELTQEINRWVAGAFGVMLLIIIFAAAFGVTMFYTQAVSKSLVLAFFIELISAVLLRLISLVPDTALYYSFPLFILSIAFAVVSSRR